MIPVGVLALVLLLLAGGASTVLLRLSVLAGGSDAATFYRALAQTVFVFASVAVVVAVGGVPDVGAGVPWAALNGAVSGVAFILFAAGLEDVEASTAKPILVVTMLVGVALGVALLAEPLTTRKLAGVGLAVIAVYLLADQ